MLGADARIVEPGGDRVRLGDLAVVVAEHVRARAVQHADAARASASRRGGRVSMPSPAASTPKSLTVLSGTKAWNRPMAFEPPPTQATQRVGQPPLGLLDLRARLAADHRLQLAHERRVRVRAGDRADDVVGGADVGDPVAQRLVHGVLERRGPVLDRRGPWRRAASCARRSAPGARRPRRPCRPRTAGRRARRPWRWRRRAGRRRSRR